MEPYLVTVTTRMQVPGDPNAVIRAVRDAQNMKAKLWLLGTKGSRRCLQGQQVVHFTTEQFTKAAAGGWLYIEYEADTTWCFAPGLDENGLPQLLDKYEDAFARRSYAGPTKPAPPPATPQGTLV